MCISAGASVSGASWKTILTPSIVCSSTGCTMSCVGAISPGVPRAIALAQPGVDLAARTARQQSAELELRAAVHRQAGQHVLAATPPP